MTWWDRRFKEEAKKRGLRIVLYQRYVDDINTIARIDLTNERDDRGFDDKEKQKERETQGMKLIQEIGNGMDESIKIEVNIPSLEGLPKDESP